ncbi:hypothetical protein H0H87_008927 [Tephrocybe sp. NHM501043]|nr:hypothetical protein H0H87_008927 [Tephrocybe sp. NHM501043]
MVALRACSLVSSSFREPSQKSIFSAIVLDVGPPSKHACLFTVLSSNPRLPPLVSSIRIKLSSTSNVDPVCDVLRLLHHVQSVSLDRDGVESRLKWDEIHIQLRDFIRRVVCLPTCKTLSLDDHLYFPTTFIRHLSHLRHLKVYDTYRSLDFTAEDSISLDFPPPSPESHIYLESLMLGSISSRGSPVDRLACRRLSHLRALHVGVIPQNFNFQECLNEFLHLEKLHFTIGLQSSSENYVDLSHLKKLRRLHIDLIGRLGKPENWLLRVLATLPSSLSTLVLSADPLIKAKITQKTWHDIDQLLVVRKKFCLQWQCSTAVEDMPQLLNKGLLALMPFRPLPVNYGAYWDGCPTCSP